MCEKSVILSLIFILKIVILLVIPIIVLFFYKKFDSKKINILFYVEFGLIALLIVLRIMNNPCIVNSTIGGINQSILNTSTEHINEDNDPNVVNKIVTNKIYKNNKGGDVYYFNNNELPLSNKKIICDEKEVYMRNFGNSITAASIAVSSVLSKNIDPIEILNYALEDNVINCDDGISFNQVMSVVEKRYGVNYYDISSGELYNEVKNGNIIVVEVKNVPGEKNVTCSTGYLIVYNIDNNNKLHTLNPNNLNKDFICPANSEGSLSIIEANSNSKNRELGELLSISSRFIKIERQ